MRKLSHKILVTVMCAIAILLARSAMAQDRNTYDQRAVNAYNTGLDAKEAGNNEDACRNFNNAATLWENAVYALMSYSMRTEEDRELLKRDADQLQSAANKAKEQARNVCGKPNRGSPSTGSTSGASNGLTPQAEAFYKKTLQSVVYPNIDRLGYYIEKSRDERLATGSWVEVNKADCYKARHELTQVGVNGEEAMLCQAIAFWLQDNAKEACDYLNRDDMKDFFRKSTFAALVKYYDRVYLAASCGPQKAVPIPVAALTKVETKSAATPTSSKPVATKSKPKLAKTKPIKKKAK